MTRKETIEIIYNSSLSMFEDSNIFATHQGAHGKLALWEELHPWIPREKDHRDLRRFIVKNLFQKY